MKRYEPKPIDIAFANALVDSIVDGGIVVFPGSGLVFRVYHQLKKLVLVEPAILSNPGSAELFEMSKVVFELIGYTVEVMQ